MSAVSIHSRSSGLPSLRKQRFGPGYDASYRFQVPRPFNVSQRRGLFRPHTSSGSATTIEYRSDQFQKAYVNAIASAQISSTTSFRQSLGDGLLMLQSDKRVFPSIFAKLHKMHMYDLDAAVLGSRTARSRLPLSSAPARTENGRSGTGRTKSRLALDSTVSSARNTQTSDTACKSPNTVQQIVVTILTKAEQLERESWKNFRLQSDLTSKSNETGDRCARRSDCPEIRIDGRSIGQNMRAENGHMPREHCDVLGSSTCPDCIRTKAQNNHLRMRNATTMVNATEVYKIALISERIPYMSPREIQRNICDGDISSTIDHVSKWKEIKQLQETSTSTTPEQANKASVELSEKARAKLTSSDSARSSAFETLGKNDSNNVKYFLDKSDEEHRISDEDQQDRCFQQEQESATGLPMATTIASQKEATRKRKPRKNTKVFNRDVTPSPNYFYNVSDLMERIKKYRRVRKNNAWDEDVPRHATVENSEVLNQEYIKDEVSSLSSQDSVGAKTGNSLKSFEPPVMYGQKARYLGANMSVTAM